MSMLYLKEHAFRSVVLALKNLCLVLLNNLYNNKLQTKLQRKQFASS